MTWEVMELPPAGRYRLRMDRPPFGELMRAWRTTRKLSQLDMAETAGVSARHLSYLETGRSRPSRDMVLLLCDVLDVPLRERNAFLDAAGFAARYRETDLMAPEMAPVRRSLEFLLARHEPYPSIVCDGRWEVRLANESARRVFSAFVPALAVPLNVVRLFFSGEGLRRYVTNFQECGALLVQRLHREALAYGASSEARALLDEVLASGLPGDWKIADLGTTPAPIVPIHLKKGDLELRLFSALTTLGTPIDVTAQECRLETFFPADAATEEQLRALSAPPS
jgi:transcriptional regulator with XRE-family HTH domain